MDYLNVLYFDKTYTLEEIHIKKNLSNDVNPDDIILKNKEESNKNVINSNTDNIKRSRCE